MLKESGQSYRCQQIVEEISYKDKRGRPDICLKTSKWRKKRTVQTRGQVLLEEICRLCRELQQEEGGGALQVGLLEVMVPFRGAVSLEGWWAEARLHCGKGKWRPWLHDSRWFCVGQTQLPGEAAKGTEEQAYSLHSSCSLRCPRSQQQQNQFFVLHIHRRPLVKDGRSMCRISCSSISVLVNVCRLGGCVIGHPDLQKENYGGAVIQRPGCSCQILCKQSYWAFFKQSDLWNILMADGIWGFEVLVLLSDIVVQDLWSSSFLRCIGGRLPTEKLSIKRKIPLTIDWVFLSEWEDLTYLSNHIHWQPPGITEVPVSL